MFFKLHSGKLKWLVTLAVTKAGSERKLFSSLGISKGKIYRYKKELTNISQIDFQRLVNFLDLSENQGSGFIFERLPSNWGRVKGGIAVVQSKKLNGTFDQNILQLKKLSSQRMKLWHETMKRDSPSTYYPLQYTRFKQIKPGYTYELSNGIAVRNELERTLGNFLLSNGFRVDYEPYLNLAGKAYFPDFKIDNLLIEVTAWRHPNILKLTALKTKLLSYPNNGYKPILFIPQSTRKFYKELEGFIISDLSELKSLCSSAVVIS